MKNQLLALALLSAMTTHAASDAERIAILEQQVNALTRQSEQTQYGEVFIAPGQSIHGLSPSASKIYLKESGLSFGGYGEALYTNYDSDKDDVSDFLRAILYVGYKFNDHWALNTEFEFEHASTGKKGSVSVEFATLDYLHSPAFNFRSGLLLVPMGIVNQLHEPTVFLSARRPDIESKIIPSTWRENGLGFFGELGILRYEAYLINGLQASGFSESGLRGGRQKGSKSIAEDFAGILRLDIAPTEGLTIGASIYSGKSGQEHSIAVQTDIAEAHLILQKGGINFRALYVIAQLDDIAELNRLNTEERDEPTPDNDISSIGEKLTGGYIQLGYDLLNTLDTGEKSLTPYIRLEQLNTQDTIPTGFAKADKNNEKITTIGLNFKPLDEIVFKAEWQNYDHADDRFNLSMGYNF